MFPVGTLINGCYRIQALLGTGGMGAVFKAFEEKNSREVALKFLYREAAADQISSQRFRQEGELLASIRHPNVVKVFALEFDVGSGLPFLIMEYFPGIPLTEFLRDVPRDLFWLLKTVLDLCEGVRAIHEKNIIHRDLKPENVLVNPRGDVRIIDFGIAKAGRRQTQTGTAMGTSLYMSPEQCEGRPSITYKSDIYSLGVMLWEILTGHPLFYADDESSDPFLAVVVKHLTAPVPVEVLSQTTFGELFSALLLPMLAKNPEERPEIAFITDFLVRLREQYFEKSGIAFQRFSPTGTMVESPFGRFGAFTDTATRRPALVNLLSAPAPWPEGKIQARVHRLMRVRHFSVADILQNGFDAASKTHFLAMEPPGSRPFDSFRKTLRQDRAVLLKFMLQVLEGLKAIHDSGECHGHLHPSRIGFNEDDDVRISGFPLIPIPLPPSETEGKTRTHIGPELASGEVRASPAADVYSAGVIFWELLFGERPLSLRPQARSESETTGASPDEAPTLNGISTADPLFPFFSLLERMLEDDPLDRPVVGDLLSLLRTLDIEARVSRKPGSKARDRGLILSQDRTVSALLHATLLEAGFRSQRAKNLEEIFRYAAEGPSIAWFIDLDRAGSPVSHLLARCREVAPDAKIILLARLFPEELVQTCQEYQVTVLLEKPLVAPRLAKVMNILREEPEFMETSSLFLREDLPEAPAEPKEKSRHQVLFFECPICRERFGSMQNKPGMTEIRGTESDFCPICSGGHVPELYAVVVCPSCHFAGYAGRFRPGTINPFLAEKFLEPAGREPLEKIASGLDFLGTRGFLEGRRSFELAATGAQSLSGNEFHRLASELFLKASWLCRRFGKALEEAEYQARALESIMALYQPYLRIGGHFPSWAAIRKRLKTGQEPLNERAVLVNCFLGAELSARLGLTEQADFYFTEIFELPFFQRFTLLARHINTAFREFKNLAGRKYPRQIPSFGTATADPPSA